MPSIPTPSPNLPKPSIGPNGSGPKVVKQSPKPVVIPQAPAGSILSRAIDVKQLKSPWIKILIYGQNRTGKTYLACTFPKPLLLVSFEPNDTGGAVTVKKFDDVQFLKLNSSKESYQLIGELVDSNPFQTIVIDSVTSFQAVVLQEVTGLVALPEQMSFGAITGDQYRERAEKTKEGLAPFVKLKCHTVFLAKEKDHNPPQEKKISEKTGKVQPDMRPRFLRGMQQESFIAADLGGGTVGWLNDACDYICRLYFDKEVEATQLPTVGGQTITHYAETGKHVRCLRTLYHPNFAAGMRTEFNENVPECIENPDFVKLQKVIKGEPLE